LVSGTVTDGFLTVIYVGITKGGSYSNCWLTDASKSSSSKIDIILGTFGSSFTGVRARSGIGYSATASTGWAAGGRTGGAGFSTWLFMSNKSSSGYCGFGDSFFSIGF